ncbi:MAG: hypothetical protein ACK4FY_04260 [Aquificaceae bacterium]
MKLLTKEQRPSLKRSHRLKKRQEGDFRFLNQKIDTQIAQVREEIGQLRQEIFQINQRIDELNQRIGTVIQLLIDLRRG